MRLTSHRTFVQFAHAQWVIISAKFSIVQQNVQYVWPSSNWTSLRNMFSVVQSKCSVRLTGALLEFECVKCQHFYQAFEISCRQADWVQKTTRKLCRKPPSDIIHQLTRPFATASNKYLIGQNGIWWFSGNRLVYPMFVEKVHCKQKLDNLCSLTGKRNKYTTKQRSWKNTFAWTGLVNFNELSLGPYF